MAERELAIKRQVPAGSKILIFAMVVLAVLMALFMNWRLGPVAAITTAGYFLLWAYHIYVQAKRRMDRFGADRVRAA